MIYITNNACIFIWFYLDMFNTKLFFPQIAILSAKFWFQYYLQLYN